MLFSKSKNRQDNLYKQSLLNRVQLKLFERERIGESRSKHRSMLDEKEMKEWRNKSLPSEGDRHFESRFGPVDDSLLKRAETAKHRRRAHTWDSSRQLNNVMEWQSFDEFRARLLSSRQQEKHSKYWGRNSSSEPCLKNIKSFSTSGMKYEDSDDETYIDENGIYTTVLCYTEI